MGPLRSRLTEMGFEEVVGAKGHELSLFPANSAFYHQANSRREIVVADAGGHPAKVLECANVPIKKRFLLLAGKGHHKSPSAVR